MRFSWLRPGTKRVAYFYSEIDDSTFRYRVYNMVTAVNANSQEYSASYFMDADQAAFEDIADQADLLVLSRVRFSLKVSQLARFFHIRGKAVVFDTDDLVFDPKEIPSLMHHLSVDLDHYPSLDYWYSYVGRMQETLKLCQAGIASTQPLASKLQAAMGKPVRVHPNFLNPLQVEESERLLNLKHKSDSEGFTVGYFSGSPSHARDFDIAKNALWEMLEQHRQAKLLVVGYLDVQDLKSQFKTRLINLPFTNFLDLQRLVASVNLNVAPLVKNEFTDCKSELKFFEAAAVGTPTLASKSKVFEACVEPGTTGLLADRFDWHESLSAAVANANLNQIAQSARLQVMKTFTAKANAQLITETFGELI